MKKLFTYIIIIALFLSINLFSQEENTEEKPLPIEEEKSQTEQKQAIDTSAEETSSSPSPVKPKVYFNEKKLLELIETNPKDPKPYLNLIKYYTSKEMRKEKLRIAIKYIQNIGGNSYMYQIIGDENRLNGDYSKALISYQYALKLNPTNSGIYNKIGLSHLKLENFNQAEASFKAAIFFGEKEGNYTRAVYYNNLGITYEAMNDIENAIKNFKIAVKLNPLYKIAVENLKRLEK